MKKIVAMSLIAVASLSLAACGQKAETTEANATDVNATATETMEDSNAAAAFDANAAVPAENASNAM